LLTKVSSNYNYIIIIIIIIINKGIEVKHLTPKFSLEGCFRRKDGMRYWKFVALCFVSRIDKNKFNENGDRLETLAAHVTLFKYTYCATINNRTITEEQKQELITLIEEFQREHKTFTLTFDVDDDGKTIQSGIVDENMQELTQKIANKLGCSSDHIGHGHISAKSLKPDVLKQGKVVLNTKNILYKFNEAPIEENHHLFEYFNINYLIYGGFPECINDANYRLAALIAKLDEKVTGARAQYPGKIGEKSFTKIIAAIEDNRTIEERVIEIHMNELAKGEIKLAKDLEQKKVVLGECHPSTLDTINPLAKIYHYQGKYFEAEGLLKHCLDKMKEVFGESHHCTLRTMSNLAATYHHQGKNFEAEVLLKQCLNKMMVVLGESHPETIAAMTNLVKIIKCLS